MNEWKERNEPALASLTISACPFLRFLCDNDNLHSVQAGAFHDFLWKHFAIKMIRVLPQVWKHTPHDQQSEKGLCVTESPHFNWHSMLVSLTKKNCRISCWSVKLELPDRFHVVECLGSWSSTIHSVCSGIMISNWVKLVPFNFANPLLGAVQNGLSTAPSFILNKDAADQNYNWPLWTFDWLSRWGWNSSSARRVNDLSNVDRFSHNSAKCTSHGVNRQLKESYVIV